MYVHIMCILVAGWIFDALYLGMRHRNHLPRASQQYQAIYYSVRVQPVVAERQVRAFTTSTFAVLGVSATPEAEARPTVRTDI